jgi:putative protease
MGECSVPLDEGINLSPSAINALRREACEELVSGAAKTLDELLGKDKITVPRVEFKLDSTAPVTRKTTALFHDSTALSELLSKDKDTLSDIDTAFVPLFDIEKIASFELPFELGVYLPPVIMESEWDEVRMALDVAVSLGVKAALIGNISHIALIKDTPLKPYGDLRLNTSNRYSRAVLSALGVDLIILSPELTLPMARDIGGAVVTLGRLPLMLTERCFIKENFGCDKCGKAALCDRKGARFPMVREWRHRNIIFNSTYTYMGDKKDELGSARISSEHYIFSTESASEIRSLLFAKRSGKPLGAQVRRVGKR